MNHVAEVENAADRTAPDVHQQVARMAVPVDRLTAQTAQHRQAGAQLLRRPVDGVPHGGGLDVTAEFHEVGQTSHIPGQPTIQGGVEKSLQGVIETRENAAGILQ